MTTPKYHKEMNVNSWAAMFKEIYFPTQNYSRSKHEIFTHLVKVFGGGSKYLFRESSPDGARDFLARIFGWYCALANRLNVDVEKALWKKYPGICPRCVQPVCECHKGPLKEINASQLSQFSATHQERMPASLRHWQMMFGNLYRGHVTSIPPRDSLALIFSRMAEELGEVAEAILLDEAIDRNVMEVIDNEMADLCAWIFALANSLHLVDPGAEGVTLADVTWNLYSGKCHRCRKTPCTCAAGSFGLELAGRGAMGQAQWDDRTGLANGEGMKVNLTIRDKEYTKTPSMSYSLIMFDLDDFGRTNKDHGNLAGDHVLHTAAKRMLSVLDQGGMAFRRGGEEFVVALAKDIESAQIQAERIRQALVDEPVIFSSGREGEIAIKISASFGVANTRSDGKMPSELENIADERMRSAKKAGKNCVHPELSPETMRRIISNKELYSN